MLTKINVEDLVTDETVVVEDYEHGNVWCGTFVRMEENYIIIFDFDCRNEFSVRVDNNLYRWEPNGN